MMNFTALMKRIRSFRYGSRLRPVRDWLVLLVCFAVLFGLSAVWNAWLFVRVANGDILGGTPPAPPALFDPASLKSLQKLFDTRAQEETKYLVGSYMFADPSQ
ncbi:MAG: hypothetical protein KGI41_02065 [Patescibacteria group bacterium]|nr:hypothetical protein [Patescibacteria group bacterium]MDE1966003.1 hypothetical protein [Patescibacteria group bacterium]